MAEEQENKVRGLADRVGRAHRPHTFGAMVDNLIGALEPGEQVMALGSARARGEKGSLGSREDRWGIAAVSNLRFLFVTKGEREQEWLEFPIESISSARSERGLVRGGLVLIAEGEPYDFHEIAPKDAPAEIAGFLLSRIERRARLESAARHRSDALGAAALGDDDGAVTPEDAEARDADSAAARRASNPDLTPDAEDAISALERLGKLHKAGVISDDEFRIKKDELLTRI
jgi:hypothetical protein